ncbi:Acyl-CoA synthetase (AMP-forming)/AMP-acid ligase II [Pseudomonas flavescens]|uniref:Acyl-CoA synthetase (AMP-forming)/AMP-acid ligase II n=1 Tax=Phytopseudomonas flavescens TaxID=29435 RepID=A0A1G8DIJ7_9GAMM|nr:fatty acid--CoA ligase family protein [Pseudomonas flavescens]SDH57190.1 Acyl-CoA synthetase (AMP-forming)/AMP-acid ligase II [Pseudomonas flavescens]
MSALYASRFERSAGLYPNKTAIVDGERVYRFRDVYGLYRSFLSSFVESCWAGKTIAVYARSSALSVAAALAGLRLGCTMVFIHHSYTPENLKRRYLRVNAELLVSDVPIADQDALHGVCQLNLPDIFTFYGSGKNAADAKKNVACIFFTSGSTGEPKGVCVSDRNMNAAYESVCSYMQYTPNDVILHYTAIGVDLGFHNSIFSLLFGGTNVIGGASPADPKCILQAIADWRVTGLQALPGQLCCLAQPVDSASFDLKSLRFVSSTGQALQPAHIRNLREKLPDVKLYSMYGMTECKRILYLAPEEVDQRPTSVGKPIPGVTAYLVRRDRDQLVQVADKEVGELAVVSEQVMQGYWADDAANQKAILHDVLGHHRVLLTGDLFRKDDDGFFYHVSRLDDHFPRNTWMVNPREVEAVIGSLPDVLECRVVPLPSTEEGNIPIAYIVLRHGADHASLPQSVIAHCVRHLHPHMVPAKVLLVDTLPRSISGKIQAPVGHIETEITR